MTAAPTTAASRHSRLPIMIDLSGTVLTAEEREFLAEGRVAGVCLFGRNVSDRYQLADYVAELRSLAGDDLIVAIDQEGGGVLRLLDVPFPPPAMALGEADDAELTFEVGAATGRGLAAVGVNLNFAPVADVNSNPANPVIADRSFGTDPTIVARHVAAFVRGLQSVGVGATLKHFPGHGDTSLDSHLALPVVDRSLTELRATEFAPFRAGFGAGAAAVMSAHIVLPQVDPERPATLSWAAMTGLLRHELGYDGLSVSDALDMRAIADHYDAGTAAAMALRAGIDLPVTIATVPEHRATLAVLDDQLASGQLPEAVVNKALERITAFAMAFPGRATGGVLPLEVEESDRAIMATATARGLRASGQLPHIGKGARVALLAAGAVRANAASQLSARPVDGLIAELRARGLTVEWLELVWGESADPTVQLGGLNPLPDIVMYVSTSRTRVAAGEARTAAIAADWARHAGIPYLHVGIWNPYSAELVPGPALLSFGYRGSAPQALADALLGS